jgi:hypothetical protein
MPINFDALVLRPNQNTFGQPVTFNPKKSRPGAKPFKGRGILRVYTASIPTEDKGIVTSSKIFFDIRTEEIDGPIPVIQDEIVFSYFDGYPPNQRFIIENLFIDGFGCVQYQLGLVVE